MSGEVISPKVIQWHGRIVAAAHRGIEAILETCHLVAEADKDLKGNFKQLVKILPWSKGHTSRLRQIGTDMRLVSHEKRLPTDHYTLYHLTHLSDDRFDELLESGVINPSMKRNEASAETRKERKDKDENRILSLESIDQKFPALVIDPPWDYGQLSLAARAAPGYATMTHDELLALDVGQWVDERSGGAHLYLWTTNNFMTRAVELMAAWGFQHKTVLTWIKPRWGLGAYFRNSTEHVLFGVRGELRTRSDSIATHFEAPMGEHSEKPEEFYEIVRQASYPSYGEVFQRAARPDFQNVYREVEAACFAHELERGS